MKGRFRSLDGWRAVSILLVLAGHLLPLSPKSWQLNGAIAASGMALFFVLSGFLITTLLLQDQDVRPFLIRRFARILPLAWTVLLITLVLSNASLDLYPPHLLFYANLGHAYLIKPVSHFWSLCVELQFYVGIATLVLLLKNRAFLLIPPLCIAVTIYRFISEVPMAIGTLYRIDEILAGCILALLYHRPSILTKTFFSLLNSIYLLPLLVLSAHEVGGAVQYFRPYLAMLIIGTTLFKEDSAWWINWLDHRVLKYIAEISYALYVIHGVLIETWLASGDTLERYLKRPLFFAVTFILAHISTFHFEKHWIALGKRLSEKISARSGKLRSRTAS